MNFIGSNRTHRCSGQNIVGSNLTVYGDRNNVTGSNNHIYGDENNITGSNCGVRGNRNHITGSNNDVDGDDNVMIGSNCTIRRGERNRIDKPSGGIRSISKDGRGFTIISDGGGTVQFDKGLQVEDGAKVHISNIDGVSFHAGHVKIANGGEFSIGTRITYAPAAVEYDSYRREASSRAGSRLSKKQKKKDKKKKQKKRKFVEGPIPSDVEYDRPAGDEKDAKSCVVCLSNVPCCIAAPCNHLSYCVGCARRLCFGESGEELKERGKVQCAECRADVKSIKRTF